jgi:hypothetical protein
MVENNRLINTQSSDRLQAEAIEQTHQIVERINEALENKQ